MFMGSFGGEELGRADLVDWEKPIENNNASAPIIRQSKEVDFFFMTYPYKTSLRSNNGKLIFTPKIRMHSPKQKADDLAHVDGFIHLKSRLCQYIININPFKAILN